MAGGSARLPRRLLLTSSSSGVLAGEGRRALDSMLVARRAERVGAGEARPLSEQPAVVAFVLDAALAGSSGREAEPLPAAAGDGAVPKRRSEGEARRRRLGSARRKANLLCAELCASAGSYLDLAAMVAEEERAHDRRAQQLHRADGGADAARLERAAAVRDACALRLHAVLLGADAVWVLGGNTFYLRHWSAQAGLDAALLRAVGGAGLPYVGQSAGAIVAGISAHTALWKGWDDPAAAPPPSGLEPAEPAGGPAAAPWGAVRLAGVGLVPCSVFPHYAPQWEGLCDRLEPTELRAAAAIAAALGVAADVAGAGRSLPALVRLRDGQALVWDEAQPDVHCAVVGTPERGVDARVPDGAGAEPQPDSAG